MDGPEPAVGAEGDVGVLVAHCQRLGDVGEVDGRVGAGAAGAGGEGDCIGSQGNAAHVLDAAGHDERVLGVVANWRLGCCRISSPAWTR